MTITRAEFNKGIKDIMDRMDKHPSIPEDHQPGLARAAELFTDDDWLKDHYADHRYTRTLRKITTSWFWKSTQVVFWLLIVWLLGEKLGIKLFTAITK